MPVNFMNGEYGAPKLCVLSLVNFVISKKVLAAFFKILYRILVNCSETSGYLFLGSTTLASYLRSLCHFVSHHENFNGIIFEG